MSTQKKLFNRYDEFQIASFFTESAYQFLQNKWKKQYSSLVFKTIIGILLFINGYLSHWGPWPWPSNYYFLIFSIIFYHVGSYIYGSFSPVKNHDGNTVGHWVVKGKNLSVVVRIGEDKVTYKVQTLVNSKAIVSKEIKYYQYFTQSGQFLLNKYKSLLGQLTKQSQKIVE